jgi:SET domain-containing protein
MLDELMMEIIAIKDINEGEEITINYNGDPEKKDPLWFTEPPTKRHPSRKKSSKR